MKPSNRQKQPEVIKLLNSYVYQRSLHDIPKGNNNTIKKRQIVYIHGNCQARAIEQILAEIPEFRKNFLVVSNTVHNVNLNHLEYLLSSIAKADFFVYQPIKKGFRGTDKLSIEYLKTILKDSCKAISFPGLFFEGYFPEQIHLKDLNQEEIRILDSPYHDYNVLYLHLKGYSSDKIVELIDSPEFYEEDYIAKYLETSLAETENRESEYSIDVKVSNFIRKNHKIEKLFYTINHPTRKMFLLLLEEILKECEIEVNLPKNGCDPIDGYKYPLYLSTYNALNCTFPNYSQYEIHRLKLSRIEYVSKIIEGYNSLEVNWEEILSSERTQRILKRKGINTILKVREV